MANVLINDQYLTDIANAIREKSNSVSKYTTDKMAAAIHAISTSDATGLTFDSIIDRTYQGEVNSKTATTIPEKFFWKMPITYASFLAATEIEPHAFWACQQLKEVYLPEVEIVGEGAFYLCYKLTDIYLPKAITIGSGAFSNCSSLITLDLPWVNSFDPYGTNFFANCEDLTHLILRNPNVVVSLSTAFSTLPSQFGNGYAWIYVPSALYDSYIDKYSSENVTFRKIEDYPDICG